MHTADIRAQKAENPKLRDRDLADKLGISEGALLAAHVGQHPGHGTVTRLKSHPDDLMPAISHLGEVMALTRNASAVHERVGTYGEYHSNPHACMVLGKEIDLRIFPRHWVHAFAIDQETDKGHRRTLQVFDAAGDAVHKVFMRDGSNHAAWAEVVETLRIDDQSEGITVDPRQPTEAAKRNPAKEDILFKEWARMTDTHQFLRLSSKLGMNRLGAYRAATGTKWVTPLAPGAMAPLLDRLAEAGQDTILFVGNRGNIQIHWGPVETVKPMGPWLNVLDDRFNLHLRGDHVAEAYITRKPTKRGDAIAVEAFDKDGMLIAQIFGNRQFDDDPLAQWQDILSTLPMLETEDATS
ncbi:MAG: ChuX/HutX family heme-like substrate-binding protein [Pseudomonadota bacterium]